MMMDGFRHDYSQPRPFLCFSVDLSLSICLSVEQQIRLLLEGIIVTYVPEILVIEIVPPSIFSFGVRYVVPT